MGVPPATSRPPTTSARARRHTRAASWPPATALPGSARCLPAPPDSDSDSCPTAPHEGFLHAPTRRAIQPRLQVATSDDPDLRSGALWGMSGAFGINATSAWDAQTDCSAVYVGIVDTGVDVSHPDLAPNVWTNPGEVAGDGVDNDGDGARGGGRAGCRYLPGCVLECWRRRAVAPPAAGRQRQPSSLAAAILPARRLR